MLLKPGFQAFGVFIPDDPCEARHPKIIFTVIPQTTEQFRRIGCSVIANHERNDPIWTAAFRGDYVVTPSHLSGDDSLEFVGRSPDQRRAAVAADPSSQADTGGSYYQGY